MNPKYIVEIRDKGSGQSKKLPDLTQDIAKGLDVPLPEGDCYFYVSKYINPCEVCDLAYNPKKSQSSPLKTPKNHIRAKIKGYNLIKLEGGK